MTQTQVADRELRAIRRRLRREARAYHQQRRRIAAISVTLEGVRLDPIPAVLECCIREAEAWAADSAREMERAR